MLSEYPGRRERHLLRRKDNLLFPKNERLINDSALMETQRLDHEEIVEFIPQFRRLVHQAVELKPNEESDVILKLKGDLDQAYEQACGLGDNQTETKDAIKKLLQVIMSAVRTGAGSDPTALDELAQEDAAREAHFALLEQTLVADILSPQSPIAEHELILILLSADDADFVAALELFDPVQLGLLCEQGRDFLEPLNADAVPDLARERLGQMEAYLTQLASDA